MSDITKDSWGATAVRLAAAIKARELTAVQALENQLSRIEALNPALNAVVSLDADGARAQAQAVDAAITAGAASGPLAGVPITLKDGIDVAGLRTTLGTPMLDRLADTDATVAARLKAAGAVVLGHSNVAPFLADFQTNNPLFGRSNNPWDLARTPGGSSGGAAAAVAAGLSCFELASDLAGSIRQPAALCGVYGLKPSEHVVPMTGFFRTPGPRPVRVLSCLGPLARSLDDLELILRVVGGPDGLDQEIAPVSLGDAVPCALSGLRIAVAPELPFSKPSGDISASVQRLAGALEAAGAQVTRALPACDWGAALGVFGELATELTQPEQTQSLGWYLAALHERDAFMASWSRFFAEVDFAIWPGAICATYPHSEPGAAIDVDGARVPYHAQVAPLIPANLAAVPALAVPGGRDAQGLPLGLQILGPRWRDLELIGFAKALEAAGALPGFDWPAL